MIPLLLDNSTSLIKVKPDVWNVGYTGNGVTVCVVDSGINWAHNNLGGCDDIGPGCKVIDGYDFCGNQGCTQEDQFPMDFEGHGTQIAGIVASNHSTFRGVAPDSKLIAMKVCEDLSGNCSIQAIGKGVDWCWKNSTKYNISIITISIGTDSVHLNDSCTVPGSST